MEVLNGIGSAFLYSIPSLILIFGFWYFYIQNKSLIKESDSIIVCLLIISALLTMTNFEKDVLFLNKLYDGDIKNILIENMHYFSSKFDIAEIYRAILFIVFLTVGEYRYNKKIIPILLRKIPIILFVIFRLNVAYIFIPAFVLFTISYGNKYSKKNNFLIISFFLLEEIFLRNSYFFLFTMFVGAFKNFRVEEKKEVSFYNETEWIKMAKSLKGISDMSYLFIFIDKSLSESDKEEFIYFLKNILPQKNIVDVGDNIFCIVFSKVDEEFGTTDVVVEKMIESKINRTKELISSKLFFPLSEEKGTVYKFAFFDTSEFQEYKTFKSKVDKDKKLFESEKINKLYEHSI